MYTSNPTEIPPVVYHRSTLQVKMPRFSTSLRRLTRWWRGDVAERGSSYAVNPGTSEELEVKTGKAKD